MKKPVFRVYISRVSYQLVRKDLPASRHRYHHCSLQPMRKMYLIRLSGDDLIE